MLPGAAVFTHLTAAHLHGIWLPPLPTSVPVFVQLPQGATRPVRPGLRVIRGELTDVPRQMRGVATASPLDALMALCRDLCDLDALVAVDSALHAGLVDAPRLHAVSRLRRRGAPRLRRVLALADGRSESAWETVLREFHRSVEASVTPQFEVRDRHGLFVARGDLRLDGRQVLHEYDGSHHLEVARQRDDLRRQRRLVEAGWIRRGYTSQDLLHRAASVLRDVDLSLDRTHVPSRIHGWHDTLRGSAFTSAGRQSLAERVR